MNSFIKGIAVATLSSSVSAEIYEIGPENTFLIQEFINVAVVDGDVIQLEEGTYTLPSTVNTNGLAITIQGRVDADGSPTTILDGSSTHLVLQCNSGEEYTTEFRNLVIANGAFSGGGGGMLCSVSSPSLVNCVFTGNVSGSEGGGMYCGTSSPLLTDCMFENNSASGWGGGLFCRSQSYPTLINCVFKGNTADNGGGIGTFDFSRAFVINCVIRENTALNGKGGGIYVNAAELELNTTMVCANMPSQIDGFQDDGSNIVQEICTCFGDISNNGDVGGSDLGIMLILWGGANPVADLNKDGIVDGGDLGLLLTFWGPCP